jgi:hypothetical protein
MLLPYSELQKLADDYVRSLSDEEKKKISAPTRAFTILALESEKRNERVLDEITRLTLEEMLRNRGVGLDDELAKYQRRRENGYQSD